MKRLTQWTVSVVLAVVAGLVGSPAQGAVTTYWDHTSEQFSFEASAIGTDVHNGVSPFNLWGPLLTNGLAKVATRTGTPELNGTAGAQAVEFDRIPPGGDPPSGPWAIQRELETGGIPADVGMDIRGSFAFALVNLPTTTHTFELSWSGAAVGGGAPVDRIMQIYARGQGDGTFDLTRQNNSLKLFENLVAGNWYEAVFEIDNFQGADLSNQFRFSLYDSTAGGVLLVPPTNFTLGIGATDVANLSHLKFRGDRDATPLQVDFLRLIGSNDQTLPDFVPLGIPEPASATLLALGGIALLRRRHR